MNSGRLLKWCMLILGECALTLFALGMFWYQDWQYSLPAPRPPALVQPEFGARLRILEPQSFDDLAVNAQRRPTLLHFFNPNCPCSRFNLTHIRRLADTFGDEVRLIAVLETNELDAVARLQELWLPGEVVVDRDGAIARQAGVYSTPQGVVLAGDGKLFFRGNYNRGRYCTEPESEFVRRALEACLKNEPLPEFPPRATIATGCVLPTYRGSVQDTRVQVAAREDQP